MTRGRPRDPSRDRAILAAARAVFANNGYTGSSMEQIAKLAGVGKDTLYRRWSNKEQLALDLIDSMAREAVRPAPIDPDPRLNLLLFCKEIVRLYRNTDFGLLVAGMVGEAARNEDLAQRFAEFWARRREIAAPLVRDVLGPGAGEHDIETVLDSLLGPIYYRLLLTGSDVSDEYLWQLVISVPWSDDSDQPAAIEGDPTTNPNGELIPAVST
ncbi:MAG: TetR/AcrR family transcriptional regulator [Acidimicrobiales bacterium]|nr:TetR/AcrR family transcriptional regulator [Acidimicrobiales bacterium]